MKKNTKMNLVLDVGVDIEEMFAMVKDLHQDLAKRHEQRKTLEEELAHFRTQNHELEEKVQNLESDLMELYSNQETLLEHVWDADVVWIEGWFIDSSSNMALLFCCDTERTNENRLSIVSRCGSWNNLIEFWDLLSHRCEEESRPASDEEIRALKIVLRLFNGSQRSKKAQLTQPEIGDSYRSSLHRRMKGSGEKVNAVWLPGLINVQGERKSKPLIETEETS